jgi:hypothetical protein
VRGVIAINCSGIVDMLRTLKGLPLARGTKNTKEHAFYWWHSSIDALIKRFVAIAPERLDEDHSASVFQRYSPTVGVEMWSA